MRPPYTRRDEDLLEALGLGYYEIERRKPFMDILAAIFLIFGLGFAILGFLMVIYAGVPI